jgi:hypothetical protein
MEFGEMRSYQQSKMRRHSQRTRENPAKCVLQRRKCHKEKEVNGTRALPVPKNEHSTFRDIGDPVKSSFSALVGDRSLIGIDSRRSR